MKLKVGDKITVMRLTGSYFGPKYLSSSIWEVTGPPKKLNGKISKITVSDVYAENLGIVAEVKDGNIIERKDGLYYDVKVVA